MSILAKLAAAAAALTLLAAGAAGAIAAPGELDQTFGDSGEATIDLDGSEEAWALALRPDGRIVVGGPQEDGPGSGEEGFVAQLGAASGALDPSYGGGTGRSLLDLTPGDDGVVDLALRPDGRIVAVGYAGDDGMVARLLATEGTLDPSFGGGAGFLTRPSAEQRHARGARPAGRWTDRRRRVLVRREHHQRRHLRPVPRERRRLRRVLRRDRIVLGGLRQHGHAGQRHGVTGRRPDRLRGQHPDQRQPQHDHRAPRPPRATTTRRSGVGRAAR